METRGRITALQVSYPKGNACITFEVQASPADAERYLQKDLDITFKEHKEKRSLDANACLWRCLGQIAEALRTDKWQVYLEMLKRYGQYTYILVKPGAVESVRRQWRESEVIGEINVNGTKSVQMLCYYGSSMYDSREFAVLLDGVVSEMRDMGLETPLPADIRRAIKEMEEREHDTRRKIEDGKTQ